MTVPRIIYDNVLEDGKLFELKGEHFHYLVRIHRLKAGDRFYLLDKAGNDFLCEVVSIAKRTLFAYSYQTKNMTKPDYRIKLIFSLLKGDKNEFVVKAGTQMGVTEFQPIVSKRTVVRLDLEKAKEKVARLQKIAEDTARTSFLSFIPEVYEIKELNELTPNHNSFNIIFSEKKELPLIGTLEDSIRQAKDISVLVGPEGGIDDEEFSFLVKKGFKPVSLGDRALKAEFAFVFGLSVVTYIMRGRF